MSKIVLREVDVPGEMVDAVAAINRCDVAERVVYMQPVPRADRWRPNNAHVKCVFRVGMGSAEDLRLLSLRSPA